MRTENNINEGTKYDVTSLKSLRLQDLLTFGYLWLPFLTFGYLWLPFLALLGLTGYYWVLLTRPYWALTSLIGPYILGLTLDLTGPYQTLPGLTGP